MYDIYYIYLWCYTASSSVSWLEGQSPGANKYLWTPIIFVPSSLHKFTIKPMPLWSDWSPYTYLKHFCLLRTDISRPMVTGVTMVTRCRENGLMYLIHDANFGKQLAQKQIHIDTIIKTIRKSRQLYNNVDSFILNSKSSLCVLPAPCLERRFWVFKPALRNFNEFS